MFSWLAASFGRGYKGKVGLARLDSRGFISHLAVIAHPNVAFGRHVFVGDRIQMFATASGGAIELGDHVELYGDTILETDRAGTIVIGEGTHVQPRCQLVAAIGSIRVGRRCEIAPGCAFYPYDHELVAGIPIRNQGITTKGDIVVGDDAWLGYGVIVLSGVTIGSGAVIGAGAVVTKSVPDNAIAVGNPARVIGYRQPFERESGRSADS